ncbi:MAG: HAD hydrolase-like protein [Candidatus Caldatribacteriota bacterium]
MLKKIREYKHIFWDWNGTLINDVWLAVKVINKMLKKRGLPQLSTRKYKEVFDFPVIQFYIRVGFEFSREPFEELAMEFIQEYYTHFSECKLFAGAISILKKIREHRITQSILSASQEETLKEKIKYYGIEKYFTRIVGLENHYAEDKTEVAKKCLGELSINPEEAILIGDTFHDYAVSKEIGCDCLLIAQGHQSYRRLKKLGILVIKRLSELRDYF